MNWLIRLWGWFLDRIMPPFDFKEWERQFPGRCPICSYHQFGVREGHTREPNPPAHECIEARKP